MLVSALSMRAPMHVGMHEKKYAAQTWLAVFIPPPDVAAFHFPISHPSLALMTYAC